MTGDDNYYTGEVDIISGASMKNVPNILWLEEIRKEDIISVGGKGASLGEMASLGLPVPRAFVVTAQAFRRIENSCTMPHQVSMLTVVEIEP